MILPIFTSQESRYNSQNKRITNGSRSWPAVTHLIGCSDYSSPVYSARVKMQGLGKYFEHGGTTAFSTKTGALRGSIASSPAAGSWLSASAENGASMQHGGNGVAASQLAGRTIRCPAALGPPDADMTGPSMPPRSIPSSVRSQMEAVACAQLPHMRLAARTGVRSPISMLKSDILRILLQFDCDVSGLDRIRLFFVNLFIRYRRDKRSHVFPFHRVFPAYSPCASGRKDDCEVVSFPARFGRLSSCLDQFFIVDCPLAGHTPIQPAATTQ